MSFREMFTENLLIEGWSNCCHEPIYTPNIDGIGLCSYCGEWAEFEENEEENNE
jgi:hypothetical protein